MTLKKPCRLTLFILLFSFSTQIMASSSDPTQQKRVRLSFPRTSSSSLSSPETISPPPIRQRATTPITKSERFYLYHPHNHNILYKTELCRNFEKWGSCPFGGKCHYAHGLQELQRRSDSRFYKSRYCSDLFEDLCPFKNKCLYKHHDQSPITYHHALRIMLKLVREEKEKDYRTCEILFEKFPQLKTLLSMRKTKLPDELAYSIDFTLKTEDELAKQDASSKDEVKRSLQKEDQRLTEIIEKMNKAPRIRNRIIAQAETSKFLQLWNKRNWIREKLNELK